MRLLAKEAADRPSSAQAVVEELAEAAKNPEKTAQLDEWEKVPKKPARKPEDVAPRGRTSRQRTRKKPGRRWLVGLVAGMAVLGLLVGIIIILKYKGADGRTRELSIELTSDKGQTTVNSTGKQDVKAFRLLDIWKGDTQKFGMVQNRVTVLWRRTSRSAGSGPADLEVRRHRTVTRDPGKLNHAKNSV